MAQAVPGHLHGGGAELKGAGAGEGEAALGLHRHPAAGPLALQQNGPAAMAEAGGGAAHGELTGHLGEADPQLGAPVDESALNRQVALERPEAGDGEGGVGDAEILDHLRRGEQQRHAGTAHRNRLIDGVAEGVDPQCATGGEADAIEALQGNAAAGHQGIAGLSGIGAGHHQREASVTELDAGTRAADHPCNAIGGEGEGAILAALDGDRTGEAAEAIDSDRQIGAVELEGAVAAEAAGEGAAEAEPGQATDKGLPREGTAAGAIGAKVEVAGDMAQGDHSPTAGELQVGVRGLNHPGGTAAGVGLQADAKTAAEAGITEVEAARHVEGEQRRGLGEGEAAAIGKLQAAATEAPVDDRIRDGAELAAAGEAAVDHQLGGIQPGQVGGADMESLHAGQGGDPAARGGGGAGGQQFVVDHQGDRTVINHKAKVGGTHRNGEVVAADHHLAHIHTGAITEQDASLGAGLNEEIATDAEHIGN